MPKKSYGEIIYETLQDEGVLPLTPDWSYLTPSAKDGYNRAGEVVINAFTDDYDRTRDD